jgi:hypothetical protein
VPGTTRSSAARSGRSPCCTRSRVARERADRDRTRVARGESR